MGSTTRISRFTMPLGRPARENIRDYCLILADVSRWIVESFA